MLEIQNLHASINDKSILNGIDLKVNAGEVHAIMGPNGSGKSTTAYVLAGREGYEVTQGSVTFDGKNLLDMEPEIRTREGLFLGFQYPVEIPGVSNMYMLKAALNAIRNHRGESELDAIDFLQIVKEKARELNIDDKFLYRDVNVGFSGG
ncbi:MAG TPA: ATP-binding cassette domain-containing protein, partial [Crenotrichaceae bacterium]|nr:ATP-binding cassette domain-containing protein [Crenotrichaceae bacterium]